MQAFKMIEPEYIINRNAYCYDNFENIKKYIEIFNKKVCYTYLQIEEPIYNYFVKNKNDYLFIRDYYYNDFIRIINKKCFLSNMDDSYGRFTVEFYRFVKYYMIKEKLYGKI